MATREQYQLPPTMKSQTIDSNRAQRKIVRQETEALNWNLDHELVPGTTDSTGIEVRADRRLQIEKIRMG
jgi:hypothetical protein